MDKVYQKLNLYAPEEEEKIFCSKELTKENTQVFVISTIGYFELPIGNTVSNLGLGISSLNALADSKIPNPWFYYYLIRPKNKNT